MGPITSGSDYASNMLTPFLVVLRPIPETAQATISGYESMHMIHKSQVEGLEGKDFLSQKIFIEILFGIAAEQIGPNKLTEGHFVNDRAYFAPEPISNRNQIFCYGFVSWKEECQENYC